MIDKDNVESISALAAMQKGMFFSYSVDTDSDAYVEQFDFTGSGTLDADLLRTALAALSRHYSVLRTIFSFRNTDEPYQVVLKEWSPPLDELDFGDRLDTDKAVAEFKAADRARGFILDQDVLLRATLIRVAEQRWRLIITFHHIILDGWSLGPLFGTLFGYYDELARTGSIQQQHEAHPYREYIGWYERQHTEAARRHWAGVLDGYEQPVALPTDPRAAGYAGATHSFTLPDDLHAQLKRFVQQERVTPSAVFQAAWGVVLQKFAYTDDVVFGSVVSGRSIDLDGVEDMLGLFVNTQPVRVTTPAGGDFVGLCRAAQDSYRLANPYEYYPLHEIQTATPLKGALLDHVVAFENYPLSAQLRAFGSDGSGPRFEGVEVFERTNYDLHVVVNPEPDFTVTFTYNVNRYSPDLMATLERTLVRVLDAAVENPQVRIDDLAVWTPDARHGSADTPAPEQSPLRTDASVIDVFKKAVANHADKAAIVWRGKEYSYREIDRWSDAVARELRDRGVEPSTGVGVLLDRQPELVAAILGLLKNGNFYVPIDIKDAPSRIEYVLKDAEVHYVCSVAELAGQLPEATHVVPIDQAPTSVPEFPWHRSDSDAVAYLMYTSGSTGAPKGCHTTHRNILRLVVDQDYFDFGPDQVVLHTSPPAFDAFTWELWGTILFGATLVQPDNDIDVIDGDRLRTLIEQHHVRSMWFTAPLFNQLCDKDPTIFATLRHLLVGGSALSVPHIAKVSEANPGLRITNGYGPTENTTFSTTHEVQAADLLRDRIPIGRALNHSTAHVLDRGGNLVPPGAIGELCVGGDGVALGYHKRPDLTRSRFVTVPQLPDERLYRTGDLARMLPDGNLDYIGRIDDQVKVNGGFRVELGEVQTVLKSLDHIEDAVVIAVDKSGGKQLDAYFVAGGARTPEDVRQELATKLAGYMIPATLVPVTTIPLNKNGKVDRHRLAELGREWGDEQGSRAARHLSETENVLRDIVADVLESSDVDIERNFFDIGVTSLTLLAINNRLRKSQGLELPLTAFFEFTSIASLAAHLDTLAGDGTAQGAADDAPAEPDEDAAFMTSQALSQLVDDSEGNH